MLRNDEEKDIFYSFLNGNVKWFKCIKFNVKFTGGEFLLTITRSYVHRISIQIFWNLPPCSSGGLMNQGFWSVLYLDTTEEL